MACLVPQFKCPNSTTDFISRIQSNTTFLLKTRQPVCFRTQCSLPMTTTMSTTVLDLEKLRLSSLESHLNSVAADRLLTYTGTIGSPLKGNLESTLSTEIIPCNEEALIAAAAAEAVALAKAAAKVARDAVLMFGNEASSYSDNKVPDTTSENDYNKLNKFMFTEKERVSMLGLDSLSVEDRPSEDFDNLDPTDDELKLLQLQLSKSIAVRSGRQTERKVKRAKAAGKAAAGLVSVTSGSSVRRKRAALQEVDYSDPLRYLRSTTSTSRLLTATEELDLSEGIQDLMKLENLHEELKERCGSEPSFSQWAAAAGVDQKTLRKRLNYGTQCKDKMIKCNIRLVISIAKNYQGAGMNLQDLVQEGCRGLVRGTEKFDASKGFKFSTYAHWWIKQAVRKSLSDQSRTIRLPFHMVEATYRVREAKKQLFSKNGKEPSDKEIAEATGLTMKRLAAVMLTPKAPRSLDQKIGFNFDMKPSIQKQKRERKY
ncbi:hypothetical protein AQUCO_01300876v1 [Aquilegia coerulea]|uniref:RNA polymerase sigma factor n=1 Tax=Aquilegia coerulea TaxID=218851 RepID=A0A2G5E3V1_AQUCA|nr:hypothetical protein AQUCO_01300876v1 [Aquilegia coerulea]